MELVSGVAQLRPEDAMVEAMLRGWRAQQAARGLKDDTTIEPRQGLVRRFLEFTNEYPWAWTPSHLEEWCLHLTAEEHLAASTIRGYQCGLRLFTEFLVDGRYGWAAACEQAFGQGQYPVAIAHEWNTIAHLQDYEGRPEARPFTRAELQQFLDYADDQVDQAVRAKRKGALAAYRDATLFKVIYPRERAAPDRGVQAGPDRLRPERGGPGVRPVRDAERPVRQGEQGAGAAPPECRVGDGLGG